MDNEDWAAMVNEQEKSLSNKDRHNHVLDRMIGTDFPSRLQKDYIPYKRIAFQHSRLKKIVTQLQVSDEKPSASSVPQPTAEAKESNGSSAEDNAISLADASLMTKALRDKLVSVKTDVEILQRDPNSPLYSIKSFEELRLAPELLKGVYGMGFNRPSKIQETALPMLLAEPPTNMIAQSQSGTGKTAAFVLAMLSRIDTSKKYPQALCLSPTYELAKQTGDVMEKMGKYMMEGGLKIAHAVRGNRVDRGTSLEEQIVIGTPGTLLDWIVRFRVFDPKKITVFVLDEADVMISTQGHQDQSLRIKKTLQDGIQMMLFSATYDEDVMRFASRVIRDPLIIKLKREEESLDNIKQFYVKCESREKKYEALANLYGILTIGQSMVFCHTRASATWLANKMIEDGHAVALLTGELDIEQRLDVLNRFRDGKEKVLITTNVCARGIDVEQVTIVINYDLPIDQEKRPDFETYLHRIGRTGRFGKSGLAVNFIDGQRSMQMMEEIQRHFQKKIDLLRTDDFDDMEKLENW